MVEHSLVLLEVVYVTGHQERDLKNLGFGHGEEERLCGLVPGVRVANDHHEVLLVPSEGH